MIKFIIPFQLSVLEVEIQFCSFAFTSYLMFALERHVMFDITAILIWQERSAVMDKNNCLSKFCRLITVYYNEPL